MPLAMLGFALLSACGGGGDDPAPPPPPPPASFTIGGSVAGLTGTGLVLQLNGANNLAVTGNGVFTFPSSLTAGTAYAVTVATQPGSPVQTCTVTSGTGTVSANVTAVLVTCSTVTYRVRGNVTGLLGTGLTLRNNGADNLTIAAPGGAFVFATPVASGATYEVSVFSQPSSPTQACTVASGSGTITNADATAVAVTCVTSNFTVGGTVSGLVGQISVRNTSGSTISNLTLSANGTFTFPAQPSGTTYAVTVVSHSTGLQTCSIVNGTGTATTANVSNVAIACVNNDATAPTVTSTTPLDTVVGTDLATTVVANFSEPLNPSTATTTNFTLKGPGGTAVAGTVSLENSNQRLVFTPGAALAFDTTYTATVTTGITDASGNALANAFTWTFNTGHKVAVGGFHTCARLDGPNNGVVKCWGSNAYGQLGLGNSTENRGDGPGEMGILLPPVFLGTGRKVVDITAGQNYTCAVLDNGSVKCWGLNNEGQLGLGDTANRGDGPNEMADSLPAVNLGGAVLQVVAGGMHTCARLTGNVVKCWGSNEFGQPGQGTSFASNPFYSSPVTVPLGVAPATVQSIALGARHSCVRLSTGQIKCWGQNSWGQLGLGDASTRGDDLKPLSGTPLVSLGAGRTAMDVQASSGHTCVVLDNAAIKCWGNNWFGQIATGTTNSQVDCAQADACIGDAPAETPDQRAAIPLGTGLIPARLAVGDRHTCVLFTTAKVKCWGENQFGELGLGDVVNRGDAPNQMGDNLPFVDLANGGSYTAVEIATASGGFHSCTVLSTGALKCWGRNVKQESAPLGGGQLGYGDTNNRGDVPGEMGNALAAVDLTL